MLMVMSHKMRFIVAVFVAVGIAVAGFFAGRAYEARQIPPDGRIEDYALQNVLADLAYAGYAEKGNLTAIRSFSDMNLNLNLTLVRQHAGSIQDAGFTEAKIRTLNAVALRWQAEAPFTGADYQPTPTNAFWLPEWTENYEKNRQMLAWAQSQCASSPSLQCKKSLRSNDSARSSKP